MNGCFKVPCWYSTKSRWNSSSNTLCIFLPLVFSSALVRKKIFWLIFCVVVLRDVHAIYNPLTSQWLATTVYIACLFQIGLTPAGYENVPRGLKPQICQPTGLQILIFPVIIEVRFVNSEFTLPDGRKKRTAKRFFWQTWQGYHLRVFVVIFTYH